MTARSKKRRMKNSRIKRDKNKIKELKTLQRTVWGKDAKELMEICGDVVDEKTVEDLKKVSCHENYEIFHQHIYSCHEMN